MSVSGFSLVHAIRAAARRNDCSIDLDSLVAVLALPWLDCAVAAEPDAGRWPAYARDAFLEPAGRLFGLTIRGIHPPEASRGLRASPEFDQHFEASYRPLMLRALEHGQPVLAWQGWPGQHQLAWGLVETASDGGARITGRIPGSDENGEDSANYILERPAVQVYVIESIAPASPPLGEVWLLARQHARIALQNGLSDRFGITTGPAAYDAWLDQLVHPPAVAALCGASALAHDSAIRFLERVSSEAAVTEPEVARVLRDRVREIAAAMRNLANAERIGMFLATEDGRRYVSSVLRSAQAASRAMLDALSP